MTEEQRQRMLQLQRRRTRTIIFWSLLAVIWGLLATLVAYLRGIDNYIIIGLSSFGFLAFVSVPGMLFQLENIKIDEENLEDDIRWSEIKDQCKL